MIQPQHTEIEELIAALELATEDWNHKSHEGKSLQKFMAERLISKGFTRTGIMVDGNLRSKLLRACEVLANDDTTGFSYIDVDGQHEYVTVEELKADLEYLPITFDPWVQIADRLPAEAGEYLVWDRVHGVRQSEFWEAEDGEDAMFDTYNADSVTHWQPLPAPPAAVKKE